MTLYLCAVKWLVLYWEHEEGDIRFCRLNVVN